ncbi:MAG: hypothetical protein ABIR03_11600 [Ginsengibacter sp.]
MKHSFFYTLLVAGITLNITSCNSQNRNAPVKKNPNVVIANSNKTSSAQKFIEGKDYTILERVRVLDKIAFTQPVEAYSLLVPKGWKSNGEIWWASPGDVGGGVNTRFKTTSPDGQYSLEVFPVNLFAYSSNPQMNEIIRNSQNETKGFGQPLDAENYFKQVFVNRELGGPTITEIKPNTEGLSSLNKKIEASQMELRQYGASDVRMYPSAISARVKWKDGSEGIVLCGILISEATIPNIYNGTYDKSYMTSTTKRIVFKYPANEYEKASKIMSTIMSSFRTNMPWQNEIDNIAKQARGQSQARHIERIRLTDEQTRQMGKAAIARGNQNLADMDTRMRTWEKSQASQDRINTNFIKAIREVETYRDGTGVVELNSGYNHAWSRSDGSNFILSDNPNFDPSSVFQDQSWKEMKQINN